MRSRNAMSSLATILAIAGLAGFGAAGYRIVSGECPFSCHGSATSAATPVSLTTPANGECPMGGCAKAKAASCCSDSSTVASSAEKSCCTVSGEPELKATAEAPSDPAGE
jgi:hypothetical protein